jgi:hypothetical protein
VRAACREEQFQKAFEILDEAGRLHAAAEWAATVEQRRREVNREVDALYARLKGEAREARRKGPPEKGRELQERVAKWGLDRLRSDLEKALAEVVPEPPPPPPEAVAYRQRWEAAMAAAGGRDYAAAAAELQKAQEALREPALKAEAAADLEVIRSVEAMVGEAFQGLLKTPRGHKLSLSHLDEAGAVRTSEGTLLRVEGQRVELRAPEGPVSIEFGELAPGAVAELFLARPGKKASTDGKTAAAFLLLEGDDEGARKLNAAGIPDRFWEGAARAAERRARPGPREVEARKRFQAAEADVVRFSSTASAVEEFATLLRDFADTAFVRRNRPSLVARAQSGKEFFFFPEDLLGGGAFQLARAPKLEACWVSAADGPAERMAEHFVELSFSVLPGAEYRCWVYAGGCCGETLTCHAQGTDWAAPHPKTKEPTAAEPGAAFWVPLRHTISTPTRLHSAHVGPKQPVRWGWVPVPLPKYPAPGPKKVRILSDQQGFAVAYAFVSAVKSAPPRDGELRELEKERAERLGERGALPPPDPTLVAHWKLDEKAGAAAFDGSGRGNTASLVNGGSWTAGKIGGALAFDGVDDHATVPHSGSLDLGAEGQSYSIALWYRRTGNPASSRGIVGKNDGEGPYPFDLQTRKTGHVAFVVWDGKPGDQVPVVSGQVVTDGAWHHVAAVRDASAKVLRLYVDGAEAAAAVPETSKGSLKNADGVWMARSEANKRFHHDAIALDDVRIYARALGAAEVQALASGRAPR